MEEGGDGWLRGGRENEGREGECVTEEGSGCGEGEIEGDGGRRKRFQDLK